MKILAVSHLFPNTAEPRYGIFVARQLSALTQEGAEVEILVPRLYSPSWLIQLFNRQKRTDHRAPLLTVDGVVSHPVLYFSLPGKSFKRRAGTAMYRAAHAEAVDLHQNREFDIVYGTDWFLGGEVARRLGSQLGIPSACLAIGDDVNITAQQSPANRQRFIDIANALTATLACGDSLARSIDTVRDGSPTLSVYGVVDLERFTPVVDKARVRRKLRLAWGKTVLLYVGYLWKRKGLIELIQAFEALHQQRNDLVLAICGTGEDEAAIKAFAERSSAFPGIRFLGAVEPDVMHEYMQSSDVFVLPSYSEGMPNAVMEAMSCGLPVVCTSVGGLPDALGGCSAVNLVPPRDHGALQRALESVLQDQSKVIQMGKDARMYAVQHFGARSNAKRILHHLESAVQSFADKASS